MSNLPMSQGIYQRSAHKGPSLKRSPVFYTGPEDETDDPTPSGARKEDTNAVSIEIPTRSLNKNGQKEMGFRYEKHS